MGGSKVRAQPGQLSEILPQNKIFKREGGFSSDEYWPNLWKVPGEPLLRVDEERALDLRSKNTK